MNASSPEVLGAIRSLERESTQRLESARLEAEALIAHARDAAGITIEQARRRAAKQATALREELLAAAQVGADEIEAGVDTHIERLRADARERRDLAVADMVVIIAPQDRKG